MDEQVKPDLEKLETLREQAMFGPEAEREAAQLAYDTLRAALFDCQPCELPGEQEQTAELKKIDEG